MNHLKEILTEIPADSSFGRAVTEGFNTLFGKSVDKNPENLSLKKDESAIDNGEAANETGDPLMERIDDDSVRIGNQIWMTHNLQMPEDPDNGIYVSGGETYFTWDAAMRTAASSGNGWRLPSMADWNALFSSFPGPKNGVRIAKQLRSTHGWESNNGDGLSGFDAYPMGWYSGEKSKYPEDESYGVNRKGREAAFWTSDEYRPSSNYKSNPVNAYCMLSLTVDNDFGETVFSKGYGLSVRLVKDA